MHKVLVMVNNEKERARVLALRVRECLSERGAACLVLDSRDMAPDLRDFDLAISLGGDGTVLAAARMVSPFGIPILPVNLGTFGFIAEPGPEDWETDLDDFFEGRSKPYNRLMLQCQVWRAEQNIYQSSALNEVVVSGSGISKLVDLEVSVKASSLGIYRADGIIVASPTGSTAYSLAAGGPILHPDMEAIILTPICPFSLTNRPAVLPGWETVRVRVAKNQHTSILMTLDGQSECALREADEIVIQAAPFRANVLGSHRRSFYEVLRAKLNWSGGV